jgi:aminopeptidase N
MRRGSRCPTVRLDLSIYRYSTTCYYEDIYIQGGNLIDDARRAMGATQFWAAMRDYLARNRFSIATTQALLITLDRHTSLDLAAWRFRARFPSLY